MEKTDEQNAEITENLDGNSNLLPTKSFTEEKEINGEKVTFYRTDAILGKSYSILNKRFEFKLINPILDFYLICFQIIISFYF